ncbi:MAG: hypothetical protein FJ266_12925 [Planctomycetes bacterium]|nr:hypothetical protein [Planctomycetota bacterium]
MWQIRYLFILCMLLMGSIASYVYGESPSSVSAHRKAINPSEKQQEGIENYDEDSGLDEEDEWENEDEFDEITGQLQGMKAILENMKQDYETRLKEMQEKISILEKENTKTTKKDVKMISTSEEKRANEPRISKEDYDAVVKQLDTLEKTYTARIEEIKKDNDIRMQEVENKLATASSSTPDTNTGKWSPAQPITLLSMGKSYMNISFDGLFAAAGSTAKDLGTLETGGHDPNQRGFTVQNLETTFEGAVDPYFKGQASIVFQIDQDGESFLEVEEAFLTSMSLPLNLQAKAGTFFTEFGRLNPFHPHAWDFADQPLVNGRFLGPDGLRGPGARLSWLAPTSNYTELFFTVQDSQGETAYSFRNEEALFGREAVETSVRSMEDMLYTPRIATSFEVTDETTVLLGASAAFGPNSTGRDTDTLIYGLDMFWKWKSPYAAGGFPFVTWQTEVMGRRFEVGEDADAGLSDEKLNNWGAYSQICWGFKKRWVAGFRVDYVDGLKEFEEHEDEEEEEEGHHHSEGLGFERVRFSPNLTFYASEFSKIRLQYNFDDILGNDTSEHTVVLQFEFLLGSHGAHKF